MLFDLRVHFKDPEIGKVACSSALSRAFVFFLLSSFSFVLGIFQAILLYVIEATCISPQRLDSFLATLPEVLSRCQARHFIEDGCVTVCGQIVFKPSHGIRAGDIVCVENDLEVVLPDTQITPIDLHLSVLYEDDSCMVIDKPRGIAVHPGAGMLHGEATILHGVCYLFLERSLPFSPSSILAHRLDKGTTGCLLIAKSVQAHRALQEQFSSRTVAKTYLALVFGVPHPSAAVIDAPIGRSAHDRTMMSIISGSRRREARTTYRTLCHVADASVLSCELHTGRTHQIRVHLSSILHPILGDEVYSTPASRKVSLEHGIDILCLHAGKLIFRSPQTAEVITVHAEIPADFADVLQRVGVSLPAGVISA